MKTKILPSTGPLRRSWCPTAASVVCRASSPPAQVDRQIVSASFKAIQLDPVSRQRTGLEHVLAADTRQTAIEALLGLLGASRESAQIDPSRTLLRVHDHLWPIIATTTP